MTLKIKRCISNSNSKDEKMVLINVENFASQACCQNGFFPIRQLSKRQFSEDGAMFSIGSDDYSAWNCLDRPLQLKQCPCRY